MLILNFIITTLTFISFTNNCLANEQPFCPDTNGHEKGDPCTHADPGLQIQCIGSQLSVGLITEFEAEHLLFNVISHFASDRTFYSIGLQTFYSIGLRPRSEIKSLHFIQQTPASCL